MSGHVLPLQGSTADWSSGSVSDSTECILAPNASPWTLDGTNTWVLNAPGSRQAIVVDPGPSDAGHLQRVRDVVEARGARISQVVITHGHLDHCESAKDFADSLRVPVRALDPSRGTQGLHDGDVIDAGDWRIDILTTPGHSSDSLSIVVPHDGSVLTGDTILGRGTALVFWPDGNLSDYLASLNRLRLVALQAGAVRLLPGHGPALLDPIGVVDAYLKHRRERLAEVSDVVAGGVTDAQRIVEIVYADVPREVWPAAEMTVRAQLAYLADGRSADWLAGAPTQSLDVEDEHLT